MNGIVRAASVADGYEAGCCFVTPLLTGHGVTTSAYEAALALSDDAADVPRRLPDESLWITFESALAFRMTRWAEETPHRDGAFAKLFATPPVGVVVGPGVNVNLPRGLKVAV